MTELYAMLKERAHEELEEIAHKPAMTMADVEITYKLVDVIKDLKEICDEEPEEMEEPVMMSRSVEHAMSNSVQMICGQIERVLEENVVSRAERWKLQKALEIIKN